MKESNFDKESRFMTLHFEIVAVPWLLPCLFSGGEMWLNLLALRRQGSCHQTTLLEREWLVYLQAFYTIVLIGRVDACLMRTIVYFVNPNN